MVRKWYPQNWTWEKHLRNAKPGQRWCPNSLCRRFVDVIEREIKKPDGKKYNAKYCKRCGKPVSFDAI